MGQVGDLGGEEGTSTILLHTGKKRVGLEN